LGDDPEAGRVAIVANEYKSLLDSRVEHKYIEIGGDYHFGFVTGENIKGRVVEVGTYAIKTSSQ